MSYTLRLMAFVKDQPWRWIPATAFEQFGRQAWRTRLSEARKKFEAAHDGTIENRVLRETRHQRGCQFSHDGDCSCDPDVFVVSQYRYVPADSAQPSAHDLNKPWELR